MYHTAHADLHLSPDLHLKLKGLSIWTIRFIVQQTQQIEKYLLFFSLSLSSNTNSQAIKYHFN